MLFGSLPKSEWLRRKTYRTSMGANNENRRKNIEIMLFASMPSPLLLRMLSFLYWKNVPNERIILAPVAARAVAFRSKEDLSWRSGRCGGEIF